MSPTASILIVDDDPALLRALPEALSLRLPGTEVDVADSAAEARLRIAATDYDAIVCDIKMPGTDGLALLAELRALRPDTPTLLITGHGEHDLALQALRGGAYDFIQKPIDREYFLASLGRAIHMRGLSRSVQLQKAALEAHALELERAVAERTRELRELTEALEQRVVQRTEDLRRNERLAMAGRTAAVAAHEIRNPLAAIKGFLQLAVRNPLHGRDEHLHRCLQEVERIEGLLREFLLLGKPEELRTEPVALAPLLRDVGEVLQMRGHRSCVEVDLGGVAGAWVRGDRQKLRQVLLNIGTNALDAVGEGEGRIRLRAGPGPRGPGWVEIRVWNSGPPIAAPELAHIFEPFYSTKERGTGLGLAICRRIVMDHGGDIVANSPADGGAEFCVTLPEAADADPMDAAG